MNKKGFSLIELLAVIIIIGIVATIGIVSISSSVGSSRKAAFVNMARNYADSASAMRTSDKLPVEPKNNEALIIRVDNLTGVDQNDDYNTVYGELVLDNCYVAIVNNKHQYKYYVTLVENSGNAIYNTEYSLLDEDSVVEHDKVVGNIINTRGAHVGLKVTVGEDTYTVKKVDPKYILLQK